MNLLVIFIPMLIAFFALSIYFNIIYPAKKKKEEQNKKENQYNDNANS